MFLDLQCIYYIVFSRFHTFGLHIFEQAGITVVIICHNQTVNDGVAHSKNTRKCAYHITFDLDLDLEHTVDAGLPGDYRVQVWWRSGHLTGRRSDFRASTKVPVSRDFTDP